MSQWLHKLTASQLIPPYCSWDDIFSIFLCDMQLLIHPSKSKKKLSVVSALEIFTAYSLILPWTPFVTNGFSCIIEQVKPFQLESNMRWEISMLKVVLNFFLSFWNTWNAWVSNALCKADSITFWTSATLQKSQTLSLQKESKKHCILIYLV